jgi:hypothetical protein
MSETLLLPAFVALFGVGAALFFLGFGNPRSAIFDDPGADRDAGPVPGWTDDDGFAVDHDEYVEYTVSWDDSEPVTPRRPAAEPDPEPATEPLASRTQHLLHAPADLWHDEPFQSWRHMTDELPAVVVEDPPVVAEAPRPSARAILEFLRTGDPPAPGGEPIGFAHNGFHVHDEQHFHEVPQPPDPDVPGRHGRQHDERERPSRHRAWDDEPQARHGRHSRY